MRSVSSSLCSLSETAKEVSKEDGKYSVNEAFCNDVFWEIFKCRVQPRIYIIASAGFCKTRGDIIVSPAYTCKECVKCNKNIGVVCESIPI